MRRRLASPYRVAAAALALSALAHAVAIVGVRMPGAGDSPDEPAYTATLAPALEAPPASAAAPKPAPAPRPRARRKASPPRPQEALATLAPLLEAPELAPGITEALVPDSPDVVALARPPDVFVPPELPPFEADALPAELTIDYALTSAFADGRASYTWSREGDRYEITGTASAAGFFAIFLQGTIDQRTTGSVTAEGLKPDKFTERLGDGPQEGLDFDWNAHEIHFRYSDQHKTGPLKPASVDWLSMIFQLAQRPPLGDRMTLRVFTQRRMYEFRLQVLGVETLDLPIGRTRAVHLRHTGETPEEVVDVWLGMDQHYLPVKLRYPVARNRLVVEQTATSITAR
jgi:hypothetical protein